MKIIITNNALGSYYGTETWVYAMARELSREHEVGVYTKHIGKMAEKIREFADVYTEMRDADLYIVNHRNCFEDIPRGKPLIYTSHGRGIIEEPPEDAFSVGVTEETAKGKLVIRNGIDCERFKSNKPINNELKNVLYLSHPHYGRAGEMIRKACHGLNLITIKEEIFEIENLINEADLVITLGRGILESLACERNVISADWRAGWMDNFSGGGIISEDNFDLLKTHAFSGRNKPIIFTAERLREEMRKYNPKRTLRKRILSEFNIKNQSKKYINLYETIYSNSKLHRD